MNKSEARALGVAAGRNAARFCDIPEIGTLTPLSLGLGAVIVTRENIEEIARSCAFESEMGARDFSPFEFTAHEFNSAGDRSEGLWEAFDAGVAAAIDREIPARVAKLLRS